MGDFRCVDVVIALCPDTGSRGIIPSADIIIVVIIIIPTTELAVQIDDVLFDISMCDNRGRR